MKRFFRKSAILSGYIIFAASVVWAIVVVGIVIFNHEHADLAEAAGFCIVPVVLATPLLFIRQFLNWFARWNP